MFEPLTTIRRKIFGVSTPSELDMDKHKQEETLEEWRKKVEDVLLKVRGSEINEPPYLTYFLKYCKYCHMFHPGHCFSKKGAIYTDKVLTCSKVRLNMKKLNERK